ncbi:MAG: hypothetical protein FWH59_02415 [Lentimicrobiaceae bacterium]|nr:hypothetical protein [Lentimicrobiaceae bacterium]
MDTQNTVIEQENSSPIIEKQNKTNIILSVIIILFGVLLTCHSLLFKTGKNMEIALIVIGVCILIVGIIIWVLKSKQMIYEKTGSVIKTQLCYFSRDELNFAQNLLAQGKFDHEKPVTIVDTSNSYFEILLSKDKSFVSVQIFEFVPFTFQPASQKYYFTDDKALQFVEYINRCKKSI